MSHKGIRLLIQDTAQSLGDDIQFTYARESDFNLLRDKRYPFIHSDLLIAVPRFAVDGVSNFTKAWTANMAFYNLDTDGSSEKEYQLILDEMDDYLDKFINKMNFYQLSTKINSDHILMTFGTQQPFIKETKDILTGWLLPVTIQVSGTFNYCGLGC